MKDERTRYKTNLVGGINQEIDLATQDQCADARNVWAPNGYIERRPGFVGVNSFEWQGGSGGAQITTDVTEVVESPIGTFNTTNVFNSLGVGERIYLGFNTTRALESFVFAALNRVSASSHNSNSSEFKVEYSLGDDAWKYLPVYQFYRSGTSIINVDYLFNADAATIYFGFASPQNWDTDTVNSLSRYWLRITILTTALDSDVSYNLAYLRTRFFTQATTGRFILPVEFSNTTLFPSLGEYVNWPGFLFLLSDDLHHPTSYYYIADGGTINTAFYTIREQPTVAVIPQFDEAYIASHGEVFKVSGSIEHRPTDTEYLRAQVESSDTFVGPGGPFDKETIAQLTDLPRGHYYVFFRGRLWVAGIHDEPSTIRYSAATPFHTVWPSSAAEIVLDNTDTSPITGLASLGEHLVVFKRKSIWLMVFTEIDAFGVARYTPTKVVSGVGCVSHHSIQQVRNSLVFLSSEGLYSFDGVSVQKIHETKGIDRLRFFMRSVIKDFTATAIHWEDYNCYLLACSVQKSFIDPEVSGAHAARHNNHVLVWDYSKNSFWLWDEIYVSNWFKLYEAGNKEQIYFNTAFGQIYKLNGLTDNGAGINSYIKTQRIGYESNNEIVVRDVTLNLDAVSTNATVEVIPNDKSTGSASGTLSVQDTNDPLYGTAVWGTSSYGNNSIRTKALNFNESGDYIQVKVSNNTVNKPFNLRHVDIGFYVQGRRG